MGNKANKSALLKKSSIYHDRTILYRDPEGDKFEDKLIHDEDFAAADE